MACALAEYVIEERAFPGAKRKVLLVCCAVLLCVRQRSVVRVTY